MKEDRFLTKSLVHHGFLLLFLTLLIQQRAEGVSDGDKLGFNHCGKGKEMLPRLVLLYLWLLADGRHRNMMTNRMMENKKPQKASSIHSSLQSCREASHQKMTAAGGHEEAQVLTDRHLDILKVILDQMMKMTDAETCFHRCEENEKTMIRRCDDQRCCGYL